MDTGEAQGRPIDADPPGAEALEVRRRRYREARFAGFTFAEAELFADSDMDVGLLRSLVAHNCPLDLMRRILL